MEMTERPISYSFGQRLKTLYSPQFLVIFPVYCLVLIPLASVFAYLGTLMDKYLGLTFPVPPMISYIIAGIFILAGFILLWYSYSFLILEGGGGPVPPFSHKTKILVTIGPYALVRHPIYSGLILAAFGVGLVVHGWLTLAYALTLLLFFDIKSRREERWLSGKFSGYDAYRKRVRKLIPWLY